MDEGFILLGACVAYRVFNAKADTDSVTNVMENENGKEESLLWNAIYCA